MKSISDLHYYPLPGNNDPFDYDDGLTNTDTAAALSKPVNKALPDKLLDTRRFIPRKHPLQLRKK